MKFGKLLVFILFFEFLSLGSVFANGLADSAVKRKDFYFTTRDGVKLDCTKFFQTSNDYMPDNGWPVIIYCHGYGDSKEIELATAYAQAGYGYYTFCYSMRGQGFSEGLSNLISTTEMDDLKEIVNYVKLDKKFSIDTNKIAIMGSSQGAIIPYMAACNGLNVRTVLSDLSSPVFASNWIENGCIKTTLYFSVSYDSTTVRYTNEVQNIQRYILSKDPALWDSLAAILPQNRDFGNNVVKNKVPMLLSNAWQDEFFNATGNIKGSASLNPPFRLYIGAIDGHGADTTLDENIFLSDYESEWLDYWLYDEPNHITDSAKYIYASSHYPLNGNMWDFTQFTSNQWEPANISPLKLYFHTNHLLGLNPNNTATDTLTFENAVLDTSLTMIDALDDEFSGLDFFQSFQKRVVGFETTVLKGSLYMVGTPKANFYYSSDANVCQFNIQIWEVDPGSSSHLVTRINYTDRHYSPGTVRQTTVEGQAHSHIFQKGNKIRIILTNIDTQPADSFLLTNPFVLPVLEPAHNVIYMSKNYLSYIELPIKDLTPDDVAEDTQEDSFETLEIFPNPCTQETKLIVHIKNADFYKIELSDELGNKLRTLNNDFLYPGIHNFNSQMQNFTSGLYFVRLTSNKERVTKVLIKD